MPTDTTLLDLFREASRTDRGVRFLDRRERASLYSYETLWERAHGCAGWLQGHGLKRAERVAIILPTGPTFYDAFFGTLIAGGIPVPLYPPVRLGRLREYQERTGGMLAAVGASLLVTSGRVAGALDAQVTDSPSVRACLRVEDIRPLPPSFATIDCEDLAFIQFSSGTTVEPKPVALTHQQIVANVQAILGAITSAYPHEEGFEHSGVSWLPLYHDMGLVGCVIAAMAGGYDLTLLPPELFIANPMSWLRAISTYGATVSPAPNFAYSLCVDRISEEEGKTLDLSKWLVAMNGAEAVSPKVLSEFSRRFGACGLRPEALTPVYGLAEAALAVTFSPLKGAFREVVFDEDALYRERTAIPRETGRALVSVGPPLPGFQVEIRDDYGTQLPDGRVGEVWVRGPSLMAGYDGRSEATANVLKDGWLNTGDLGFVHTGELYLYGRSKDLVILRGRNYAPDMFESVADQVNGVRIGCSAAVGVTGGGDRGSEDLMLFVEREKGCSSELDERLALQVTQEVGEATGIIPHRVEVLEPGTLPRTSSGKIQRAKALAQYRKGQLDPPKKLSIFKVAQIAVRRVWGGRAASAPR